MAAGTGGNGNTRRHRKTTRRDSNKGARRTLEAKADIRAARLRESGILLCGRGDPTDADLDAVEAFARFLASGGGRG